MSTMSPELHEPSRGAAAESTLLGFIVLVAVLRPLAAHSSA